MTLYNVHIERNGLCADVKYDWFHGIAYDGAGAGPHIDDVLLMVADTARLIGSVPPPDVSTPVELTAAQRRLLRIVNAIADEALSSGRVVCSIDDICLMRIEDTPDGYTISSLTSRRSIAARLSDPDPCQVISNSSHCELLFRELNAFVMTFFTSPEAIDDIMTDPHLSGPDRLKALVAAWVLIERPLY